jgi:hypothetical protein
MTSQSCLILELELDLELGVRFAMRENDVGVALVTAT